MHRIESILLVALAFICTDRLLGVAYVVETEDGVYSLDLLQANLHDTSIEGLESEGEILAALRNEFRSELLEQESFFPLAGLEEELKSLSPRLSSDCVGPDHEDITPIAGKQLVAWTEADKFYVCEVFHSLDPMNKAAVRLHEALARIVGQDRQLVKLTAYLFRVLLQRPVDDIELGILLEHYEDELARQEQDIHPLRRLPISRDLRIDADFDADDLCFWQVATPKGIRYLIEGKRRRSCRRIYRLHSAGAILGSLKQLDSSLSAIMLPFGAGIALVKNDSLSLTTLCDPVKGLQGGKRPCHLRMQDDRLQVVLSSWVSSTVALAINPDIPDANTSARVRHLPRANFFEGGADIAQVSRDVPSPFHFSLIQGIKSDDLLFFSPYYCKQSGRCYDGLPSDRSITLVSGNRFILVHSDGEETLYELYR